MSQGERASAGAEYAGHILGALVGFLGTTFLGWSFLMSIVWMAVGAIVGGAVGYALWMGLRR